MFSRRLTIIFISGLIFSCGLKVGEPVPNSDVVELRNTKCLNESIESLKLFLNGQAKDSEVDSSFKCFSQVLIAFKDNINGSHREFFAPEELAYFVEVNFLKGQRSFRTEFLAEIMKFKTVLVGGSKTVFYKNDLLCVPI